MDTFFSDQTIVCSTFDRSFCSCYLPVYSVYKKRDRNYYEHYPYCVFSVTYHAQRILIQSDLNSLRGLSYSLYDGAVE